MAFQRVVRDITAKMCPDKSIRYQVQAIVALQVIFLLYPDSDCNLDKDSSGLIAFLCS
jgi:hypothetical protein